jgi:hypothetical protein
MLFLLRPPQTYMPYSLPRDPPSSAERGDQLDKAYSSTRRVASTMPSPDPAATAARRGLVAELQDLAELRESGALSDEEFEMAKAKLLSGADAR